MERHNRRTRRSSGSKLSSCMPARAASGHQATRDQSGQRSRMQWTAQQVSASYDAICRHHGLCVRTRPITANTTPSSDIGRDWSRHEMASFSTQSAPCSIASDNTAGEARERSSISSIQHTKKASNFAAPKKQHWSNVCCAP